MAPNSWTLLKIPGIEKFITYTVTASSVRYNQTSCIGLGLHHLPHSSRLLYFTDCYRPHALGVGRGWFPVSFRKNEHFLSGQIIYILKGHLDATVRGVLILAIA